MLAAVRGTQGTNAAASAERPGRAGEGVRILLVDHEDSFVHTLANYFRQTGAEVTTLRTPVADEAFARIDPDLVVLSPGPGAPSDFDCGATIAKARARDLPIFGVCLGQQALAQHYGASLDQLAVPMHGKPSRIEVTRNSTVFSGLEGEVTVGRYHSLHAREDTLPEALRVTARTSDGVVMAVEHATEPVAAVQFHPESIMSLGQDAGQRMIENVVAHLARRRERKVA